MAKASTRACFVPAPSMLASMPMLQYLCWISLVSTRRPYGLEHISSHSQNQQLLIDAEMPAHVADYKMSLVCTWLGSAKECAKPRKGIIKHKQHQIEQAQ